MKPYKFLPVLAVGLLAGACADIGPSFRVGDTKKEAQALRPVSDPFQQALVQGYKVNADDEYDQGNYRTADRYYHKAIDSAAGKNIVMEETAYWIGPSGIRTKGLHGADLQQAVDKRAQLAPWIEANQRSNPQGAAMQQLKYDCWIEQTSEQQYDQAALCAPMAVAAAAPAPTPAVAVTKPAPTLAMAPAANPITTYTIHFAHNSVILNEDAKKAIGNVSAQTRQGSAVTVFVEGYADRSGDQEYNRKLAEQRAAVVIDAINASGSRRNPGVVTTQSYGEDRPAVQTADGVREWANRRVEIRVQ